MTNQENMKGQSVESSPESLYTQFIEAVIVHNITDVSELIKKLLKPKASMTPKERLAEIDKLKTWLDSFRPLDPTVVSEMKKVYDVKFTYNSNAIEGNTLTQSETELVLEKGITIGGKTLKEHLEVIGHKEAIDYMEELAQKDATIGEWEIKELHSLIMRGINHEEAGRYRKVDVESAGTGHVYPPHYKIQDLMQEFAAWLASKEAKKLHPVEYAALTHYRFVSIHPFRDGNGRVSRLLMNLILFQNGFPIAIIPNARCNDYIQALFHGQKHGDDMTPFLSLVYDTIKDSLINYLRVISTASGSKGKGVVFYEEIQAVLKGLPKP